MAPCSHLALRGVSGKGSGLVVVPRKGAARVWGLPVQGGRQQQPRALWEDIRCLGFRWRGLPCTMCILLSASQTSYI